MSEQPRDALLISPEQLAAELGQADLLVLDVRWRLDQPDGRAEFAAGHIPGAIYVSLHDELAQAGAATDGRHPLPTIERFRAAVRRWGMTEHTRVVVTDDTHSWAAGRAWWVLRYAGHEQVRVLDGGLEAWRAAGMPLERGAGGGAHLATEESQAASASASLPALEFGACAVLSIDDVAELAQSGQVLDARAPERYRGEVEPLDPRAGHIPGARNAPVASVFDADGRFRSAEELREQFLALGVNPDAPVGVYCGSGVSATPVVLALSLAGFQPALYPGSWSAWSNHADRPVATGEAS